MKTLMMLALVDTLYTIKIVNFGGEAPTGLDDLKIKILEKDLNCINKFRSLVESLINYVLNLQQQHKQYLIDNGQHWENDPYWKKLDGICDKYETVLDRFNWIVNDVN